MRLVKIIHYFAKVQLYTIGENYPSSAKFYIKLKTDFFFFEKKKREKEKQNMHSGNVLILYFHFFFLILFGIDDDYENYIIFKSSSVAQLNY